MGEAITAPIIRRFRQTSVKMSQVRGKAHPCAQGFKELARVTLFP